MRSAAAALIVGFGLSAALIGAPAQSQRPTLAMLDQIDTGRWELRAREPGSAPLRMCVANGRQLIQLRHPTANCTQQVIDDTENMVTVQYICRGQGYGRTEIRRETSQLLQVESQGIAGGLPFAFSAEARRIGDCGR